jgi:hypothetical protein
VHMTYLHSTFRLMFEAASPDQPAEPILVKFVNREYPHLVSAVYMLVTQNHTSHSTGSSSSLYCKTRYNGSGITNKAWDGSALSCAS